MKRLIVLTSLFTVFAFMAMTTNVQAQSSDQTEINLSLTVDEYIEALPNIDWDLGETYQSGGGERLFAKSPEWNVAYANCGFTATLEEGERVHADIPSPRFARAEEGENATGYDVLRSLYRFYIISNGVQYPSYQAMAHAGEFPFTREVDETPHNGQVKMKLELDVNGNTSISPIPLRKTEINENMEWDESADAGEYKANMVVTFSAL